MIITIEEKSGFCYGVVRVIELAEKLLIKGEKIYCLGQIVHNEEEVNRLSGLGMVFIEHKDLSKIKNAKLLIRAHGEPPSTYETARKNNLEIIEGTCPIVLKLQDKIKKQYSSDSPIIIFGKAEHPEVIGLKGQTGGECYVISSPQEAENIPLGKKAALFSQTTMDSNEFDLISEILQRRMDLIKGSLLIKKTICGHVSHRKPNLEEFSKQNDVIIFVGGLHSSNAKYLYKICKDANPNSFFISRSADIKNEWFTKAHTVGICGATSTPSWQLKAVADEIENSLKN
jgi:4-hydroxy-3-methylbut-2-en-1-yl diphosphate reductase